MPAGTAATFHGEGNGEDRPAGSNTEEDTMDDRDRIKDRTVDVLTAAVLAAVALVVVAAIVAAGWRLVVWILP